MATASGTGRSIPTERGGSDWLGARVTSALAVTLGAALLFAGLGCKRDDASSVRAEKVFFLGVDGASWKVMGPMLEAGELPNFQRVAAQGAVASHFDTMDSTHSPEVWTTVATGREPDDHGIRDYVEKLPNGMSIPISSNARKVKAIWELASEQGLSVGVAGWWASWPAERVEGYVISDHANPAFTDYMASDGLYWTADRQRLAALERDFFPADLAPVLSRHWLSKQDFDYAEFRARSGLDATQMKLLAAEPWNRRSLYSLVKTFYSVDYPLATAMADLVKERPTRLAMLYVRGPDPVQHYGWNLVEPRAFSKKPPNLARDRGVIPGVYRYVDSFLGEILDVLDDDTWLIIASDHGAEPSPRAMRPDFAGRPGAHTRSAKGILMIRGPHVVPGAEFAPSDPRDLMPTMAWLLGLPIADVLPGRTLTEVFDPEFVAARPVHSVADYGPRAARDLSPSAESAADEAMLESLRALGYIE